MTPEELDTLAENTRTMLTEVVRQHMEKQAVMDSQTVIDMVVVKEADDETKWEAPITVPEAKSINRIFETVDEIKRD